MADVIIASKTKKLNGTVEIGGAKNSALKLIGASLIGQDVSKIGNVPDISDIHVLLEVMDSLGCQVKYDGKTVEIDTSTASNYVPPYELVSKFRAGISLLGPILAVFGRADVAMPGGCQIGARNIDLHMKALMQLGYEFEVDGGYLLARESKEGCHPGTAVLDFPSVGATENFVMAATAIPGTSILIHAACEPEIEDLCSMLNEMGCHVNGGGTPVITIEGKPLDSFHGTNHNTIGDRIEAGTFLCAGALFGGPVTVEGVNPKHLCAAIQKLEDFGCKVICSSRSIMVSRCQLLIPTDITTAPHPGFPTDLQAPFLLLDAMADGKSLIAENIFENRFMAAIEMNRLGTDVVVDGKYAKVNGVKTLVGAPVSATDLRGGAALVLAGLAAEGETVIDEIHHIDRGYPDFVGKLQSLGANIKRVPEEEYVAKK